MDNSESKRLPFCTQIIYYKLLTVSPSAFRDDNSELHSKNCVAP